MDATSVIAVAAVVVAVAALSVSVWEGVTSRKHNRLSVRPLLKIEFYNTDSHCLSACLYNNGLGPAVIDSNVVEIPDSTGGYRLLADPLKLHDELEFDYVMLWGTDAGDFVAPQSCVTLMDFGEDLPFGSAPRLAVLGKLEGVTFVVDYSSLYGEHYRTKYRFTDGFLRPA